MGTQYHITVIPHKDQPLNNTTLQQSITTILSDINQQMSTYIPNSEISLFNQAKHTDWFPVSSDLAYVVSSAQKISKLSNGSFDITVAPLIDLWGFGTKTQFTLPTTQQIHSALENTGYDKLNVRLSPPSLRKTTPNLQIDLSAIAKGFAVDKICEFLDTKSFTDYLVEIGGEIRSRGLNSNKQPWIIAIESPSNKKITTSQTLFLSNSAIATSGDYRNYFTKNGKRYSHTIDPTTGRPVIHNLASVTVLYNSTMIADALATTLMVLGDKNGKTFVNTHNIKVNMIIRNGSDLSVWKNYTKDELVQ